MVMTMKKYVTAHGVNEQNSDKPIARQISPYNVIHFFQFNIKSFFTTAKLRL